MPLNAYPLLICSYKNRNHEDYEPNCRFHTLKYQIRDGPQVVDCKKDYLGHVKKEGDDTYDQNNKLRAVSTVSLWWYVLSRCFYILTGACQM